MGLSSEGHSTIVMLLQGTRHKYGNCHVKEEAPRGRLDSPWDLTFLVIGLEPARVAYDAMTMNNGKQDSKQ